MAKQYSAAKVVQMLECESKDEFDRYIDENYDSDENEVEFEVTDIDNGIEIDEHCEEIEYTTTTVRLDSSNNVSLDTIEISISSCLEYGSSGSSAYLSPEYSHLLLLLVVLLICPGRISTTFSSRQLAGENC